jgi:hypothetical protein
MRTRLIRPAFWTDFRMADLSDSARLTFIGLWCLAVDAGYFEYEPREIAAELYRYRPTKQRERQVADHLQRLVDDGRVKHLDCGRHAVIPSLPDHRIKGGQQLFTIQKEHESRCPTSKPVALRSPTSDSVSVSGSVSVSETFSGSVSVAPAGAAKNGSKTHETDEERLARYRSYIGDKSKSADIREAAAKEVELIESRMAVH